MSSFMERSGSRIAIGIGTGTALGVALGSLALWLPLGIVAGVLWEKRR